MKTGIFYGSTTGNTESVAASVAAALGVDVILLALLDAAMWLVLSRKASVTYCLREYTK